MCAPSQKGGLAVRLQPHQATFFGASMFTMTGFMPVLSRLCAPSQYGCFAECPQEHHALVPAVSSTTYGPF